MAYVRVYLAIAASELDSAVTGSRALQLHWKVAVSCTKTANVPSLRVLSARLLTRSRKIDYSLDSRLPFSGKG